MYYIHLYYFLGKFRRRQTEEERVCMKCQSLFSGKNKKTISPFRLLSFYSTCQALDFPTLSHRIDFKCSEQYVTYLSKIPNKSKWVLPEVSKNIDTES